MYRLIILLLLTGCLDNNSLNQIVYREITHIRVYITGHVQDKGWHEVKIGSTLFELLEEVLLLDDAMPIIDEVLEANKVYFINSNLIMDKFDLNTVTYNDLITITGIKDYLATNIIEYRISNGQFNSVYDLLQIKGVKEKKFATIYHYFEVHK